MTTNNALDGAFSETTWKIYEVTGALVAKRDSLAPSTTYIDTITLGPSCYKLVVEDKGCDGLYFWNNSAAGIGSFFVKNTISPIHFQLPGYFSGDFGCGFTQYFTTDWPNDVPSVINANEEVSIEAVPNPAKNIVTIHLNGMSIENSILQILDAMGRIVVQENCKTLNQQLNIENLNNGFYTVRFLSEKGNLHTGLIISK
jgi:hypothetical protein